jgi:hypothetical protein
MLKCEGCYEIARLECPGCIMAIFSRRTLQRLINENASFLTTKQLKKHVDSLNNADEHSLGAEWEVVLLNCFSKAGTVTHEPKLGK